MFGYFVKAPTKQIECDHETHNTLFNGEISSQEKKFQNYKQFLHLTSKLSAHYDGFPLGYKELRRVYAFF